MNQNAGLAEADESTAARPMDIIANIKSPNLAFDLDDNVLATIGRKVVEEYEIDLNSRKASGWDALNEQAVKLAMQVKEEKTYPWPNAANIKYPLVTVAAIQFGSRSYAAVVDGFNVVKGKVLGEPSDDKQARADRIAAHMSFQLLEEMVEWEGDTDRMLHMLPVVGCMFRKVWFDPVSKRNRSELITPDKLVVNYWAKTEFPRMTQLMEYYPHQITERFRGEIWREVEIGQAQNNKGDEDAAHEFLEQHRLWDLDGDGYPEPYIITVHKETSQVVRIVARYDEEGVTMKGKVVVKITPTDYFIKYGFIPSLDGSYYDIGFGSLLNALNESINAVINQLLDAGHLSNLADGMIGEGVTLKSGKLERSPGKWHKVQSAGGPLKDNIVPFPVAAPSAVLFSLLGMLIEAAKDITNTKDILTGETQGNDQAVGTTLAMIEQGLKVYTSIYKRIHRSLKWELSCLRRLNRLYLDPQAYFNFQDKQGVVAQEDYRADDVDVIPVSDPTVVTDMQRMGRAQFLMQFLGKGLDDQKIITRVLEAGNIPDVKDLFPKEAPPPPPDVLIKTEELKLQARKIDQDDDKLDLEERKFALEEAKTKATNTKTYADALVALSTIGQDTTGPDGETIPGQHGLSPAGLALLTQVHQTAVTELGEGQAEVEQQEANDDAAPVHGEDLPGMEEQPAEPGVPGVPEGAAIEPGAAMDGGGELVPGEPDQGQADGGAVGPELV
jgi:chaperonin GroES